MRRYLLAAAASLACFAMALFILRMPIEPSVPAPIPDVQFIQTPSNTDVRPSDLLYKPSCYLATGT